MAAPTTARMIAHWVVVSEEADQDGGATAECISTGALTAVLVLLPVVRTGWLVTLGFGSEDEGGSVGFATTATLEGLDRVAGWDVTVVLATELTVGEM